MGRRARTNCSPIDSAMEKYHNDIGSRLSGVFVPPQPCLDNSNGPNSTADALGMFTLDMRTKANVPDNVNTNHSGSQNWTFYGPTSQHDATRDRDHSPAQCPVSCQQTSEKSNTLPTATTQTPASVMSQKTPESHSCGEDKEKRSLVDKLTRALFQRKHTCTRCQRKSRSCLPNKNFHSNDKHYMCGGCRETSHVMKSLVSGQTAPSSGIDLVNAGPNDVILHKPRTQLKDSGYETVTSCSTVASAHSHCHCHSAAKAQIPTFGGDETSTSTSSQRDNTAPPCRLEPSASDQQASTHGLPVQTSYCNPAGLEQYMGVTRDDSPVRVLKQVKTRYVENYDGYLPNTPATQQACVVKRPALPAFATTAPTSEGVDFACETIESRRAFNTTDQECIRTTGCQDNKKLNTKVCYTCGCTSKPCFRLPWEGGWLCEDCLDGVF